MDAYNQDIFIGTIIGDVRGLKITNKGGAKGLKIVDDDGAQGLKIASNGGAKGLKISKDGAKGLKISNKNGAKGLKSTNKGGAKVHGHRDTSVSGTQEILSTELESSVKVSKLLQVQAFSCKVAV
jgi:hypothetical protein